MVHAEVIKVYKNICSFIEQKQLIEAFNQLDILLDNLQWGEAVEKKEELQQIYRYMLSFTFEGVKDPEQETIYTNLVASLYKLLEEVKEELLLRNSSYYEYSQKRYFLYGNKPDIKEIRKGIEESFANAGLSELLEESFKLKGKSEEYFLQREKLITQLFRLIWFSNHFSVEEKDTFLAITNSSIISVEDKCVTVSALVLSLLRSFDEDKILMLIDLCKHSQVQVAQRALVAILPLCSLYANRLIYFSSIHHRLLLLFDDHKILEKLYTVIIQFIRSCETDKIAKRLHEEILPEVMKVSPLLQEKMDIDSLLRGEDTEEKNPEWQEILEESGLSEKLKEFSELQMEGADVYMSTFAMLKNFPFFNDTKNWFLPFFVTQSAISSLFDGSQKTFLTALMSNGYMCNSDKYSFCLSLMQMPSAQRNMMTQAFKMETQQGNEIQSEDAILAKTREAEVISNLYIQDMYRFFHLFPQKDEFTNPFNFALSFHNTWLFGVLSFGREKIRQLAEYYFIKGHYLQALDLFLRIEKEETEKDKEIYQKIGYSYQESGDYVQALKYYLQADIIQPNDKWTIRKIAYCYRLSKECEKALVYYKKTEELLPENMSVLLQIGNCYMQMEQYNEALAYYYKVEYLQPDNIKVWRAIAWCSFLCDKYTQADKFYTKVLASSPHKLDYLNAGHVLFIIGKKKKAIANYLQSLSLHQNSGQEFFRFFRQDFHYLLEKGIEQQELYLLEDYLKYQFKEKV